MSYKRDIEFLFELGSLRNMDRGWKQHLGVDCANDMEHTLRVLWLALILARKHGGCDESMIIKMALTHDLCETRVSDHSYIQKVYVKADEEKALNDTLKGTSLEDFEQIQELYEARESIESKIVKDADNLDVELELKELIERGHQLPKRWQVFRQMIHDEKLHTKVAKDFWKDVQDADPADWHMNANKWVKMPETGK